LNRLISSQYFISGIARSLCIHSRVDINYFWLLLCKRGTYSYTVYL